MNIGIFRTLPIYIAVISISACESSSQTSDVVSSPASEEPKVEASVSPVKSRFNEGDFFTNKVSDEDPTILSGIIDTRTLQQAIKTASKETNGGVVRLEAGTYKLGQIDLKSNVRLEIDPDAVLIPTGKALFAIGRGYAGSERKGKKIPQTQAERNIEITTPPGSEGRFTIDVSSDEFLHARIRPFTLAWVHNFSISNVHVKDNYSKFSAIALGQLWDKDLPIDNNPTFGRTPENGIIKNASTEKAAYGYGLIQTQALKNVLFRNLEGQGGVTLRLESGFDKSNQASRTIGGIVGAYAENISNTNGSAALLLSPHGKENGSVEIHNVKSYGSEFAVRIAGGFVNRKLKKVPDCTLVISRM